MLAMLSTACGGKAPIAEAPPKPPAPAFAHVTVQVDADANPDATGRPSPVVVRLYQLASTDGFGSAPFFSLFDDEETTLGAEVIGRAEVILPPTGLRAIDVKVDPATRHLAAVAAFRDIRNAEWRTAVPIWVDGPRQVTVRVGRARVAMTVAAMDAQPVSR